MADDIKVLPPDGMSKNNILDILSSDDEADVNDAKSKSDDLLSEEVDETDKGTENTEDDLIEEEENKDDKDEENEDENEEKLELDDKDEELIIPVKRKEILAAYPDLFKKFPYIEKAIYREQQFSEVYPTPAEAKESVERIKEYEHFQQELSNGSPEGVLKAIADENPEGFGKLVDNYLPALQKVNPQAFGHIVNNIYKAAIVEMVKYAKANDNEDVKSAAQIAYQFIFGNADWVPPSNFSKETGNENKELTEVRKEKEELHRQRFDEARDTIQTRVENTIKSTIDQHIDKTGQMSDYVKSKAVTDCITELNNLIDKDVRFKSTMNRLWKEAMNKKYNKESLESIRSVYLTRVKVDLKQVIQSVRNKALKGSRPVRNVNDETRSKKIPVGNSASPSRSGPNAKQTIPAGMSIREFLTSD
jgi:hypothetical protein